MTIECDTEADIRANMQAGDAPFDLSCAGAWVLRGLEPLERRLQELARPDTKELSIDASAVTAMDTSGAWLLHRTVHTLQESGCSVQLSGLRPEFDALLRLV